MKKITKILILITIIFTLTACGNKTYKEITYDELNTKLENKESFILFIGSDTCSACSNYKVTLNQVIEKYGTEVFYLDLHNLSDKEESAITGMFPISGTPTTVFIKNGKEKDTFNRIVGSAKSEKIISKFKENGYIKE